MLTIQQAAFEVLLEVGEQLKSLEIARRILAKNVIQSEAKNSILSLMRSMLVVNVCVE